MNNLAKQLFNMINSMVASGIITTEEEINSNIIEFRKLPAFISLTFEDVNEIRKKILSEQSIKLNLGTLIESDTKYEKWFLNRKANLDMQYWDRYREYLLNDKGLSTKVVNTMDTMLDTLTDLLGDPEINGQFQRRGLIIGDVQSGKTSNYTGLICKAADAGYKVIVLLTGTIEKLRKQTQLRMDEGFVGMDSAAMIKQKRDNIIGVGNYNQSIHPMVLTSTNDDFKPSSAKSLGFNLATINQPVLFVIKKNVSTLKHLNKWLKTFNKNKGSLINHSILVVDDESDNASVNTNPEDRNPTTINAQIRKLLSMFTRASYVGFTATPFANIFIDPNTNDEMLDEDLFPKDYIYSLNAPSNYIGARNIFSDEGEHRRMLVKIDVDGVEEHIPSTHKGDDIIDSLPSDLHEAINLFLVANVVRDLRGDKTAHRSMLINVSRFTNIQEQIGSLVNNYLKDIQMDVKLYGKLDVVEALKNYNIKSLKDVYDKYYYHLSYEWEDIQNNLHESITPIIVAIVNQKSKNGLNYEEHETHGLRAIAVGGISLSRGLTLEGLVISYFYRNSKMYDTLMQMGRWFGYRKNYEDLCKIWMAEESIEWYEHISRATDELRRDIKVYEDSGMTPKDFGLRVRSDINVLLVTARNKMRTADSVEVCVTLSGEVVETPNIYSDVYVNKRNKDVIDELVKTITKSGYNLENTGNKYYVKNVDKEIILKTLGDFEVSLLNSTFNSESICEFIKEYKGNELLKWDIGFATGSSDKDYEVLGKVLPCVERSFSVENNKKILKMSGSKKRLGSTGDGEFGLSKEEIRLVKTIVVEADDKVKSVSQKSYFRYMQRNPLLVIYMVSLKDCKSSDIEIGKKIKEKFIVANQPLVGLSIGIPQLKEEKTKYARYTINKVQQSKMNEYEFSDEVGDEE